MTSDKKTRGRIPAPFKRTFIIDGIPQPLTPEAILLDCAGKELPPPVSPADRPEPVADETIDLAPGTFPDDGTPPLTYLPTVLGALSTPRRYPVTFPESYACSRIAGALIETLFRTGHFSLEDLSADLEWTWDSAPIGNMAALYAGVNAACEYIDNLGIRLRKWSYSEGDTCSIAVKAGLSGGDPLPEDELEEETPGKVRFGRKRICPATFRPLASDWIVYIPFDSCLPRLGGSVLSEALGAPSATAPDIADADYFIDCYEVVRELIEDGVVKAGAAVGPGGLLTALHGMSGEEGIGASVDLTDLRKSWEDSIPVRVLYGEVPGVLIEIADIDFDYVDAELLLQDIAYFPIGHPSPAKDSGITLLSGEKKIGIATILDSLLTASEGED